MKFPLPACPFPPLVLSEQDKRGIQAMADKALGDTLAEYEALLERRQGVVDLERWRPIKRKENLVAYEDRCALAVALQQTNSTTKPRLSSEDPISVSPPSPTPDRTALSKPALQQLLHFGTINCELEDLLLGDLCQTTETFLIRSSYVDDHALDFTPLATLVAATPEKPFDGLQIKWSANNLAPMVASGVIRNRDGVYLDASGVTISAATGDRIGYHILHSFELPGAPELTHYKLVRGDLKSYVLFRQKTKGVCEVYGRVMYDLKGEVPAYISTTFSAEAINFLPLAAIGSQKRKLTHLLHTAGDAASMNDKPLMGHLCGVCTKELSTNPLLAFNTKTCRICASRICSRCRVPKKLSFLNRRTRGVTKRSIDCCTRCMHTAFQLSAEEVARNELRLDNPAAVFYEAVARKASSVSIASD